MNILPFLLQVVALLCLLFATFGLFPTAKVSWFPAGMFFWLLSLMVSGIALHPITH
jgi:hypothetical protein